MNGLQPQAFNVFNAGENDVAAQFYHAGELVHLMIDQVFHFLGGGGHRMDVKLVFSRDPVDLGNGIIFLQQANYLGQGIRPGFNLKIAGNSAAYFLRINNSGIFFNNAPLLQCLNPHFYGNPGNSYFMADIRIGHPRVFDQQSEDFLIKFIQSVQKHGIPPERLC